MKKLSVLAIAGMFVIGAVLTASTLADARARKGRTAATSSAFPPAYTRGSNQGDGPPWPQLNHD
jgi:hypothetical protein